LSTSRFEVVTFLQFVRASALFTSCRWQCCQMLYFQTKNPNLDKYWKVMKWKMLVLSWPLCLFYSKMVYFMVIWYIFPSFGMLCRDKSGNPGRWFLQSTLHPCTYILLCVLPCFYSSFYILTIVWRHDITYPIFVDKKNRAVTLSKRNGRACRECLTDKKYHNSVQNFSLFSRGIFPLLPDTPS
jgi:hypothetical protein